MKKYNNLRGQYLYFKYVADQNITNNGIVMFVINAVFKYACNLKAKRVLQKLYKRKYEKV